MSEATADLGHRARGGDSRPVQASGHLRPCSPVTVLGEERTGQKQVDHHAGGQVSHPFLRGAGLAKSRVDHLEGHDLALEHRPAVGLDRRSLGTARCDDGPVGHLVRLVGDIERQEQLLSSTIGLARK